MIRETFNALKAIGVPDENILAVITATEQRHNDYRAEMAEMKRDLVVLKWAMAIWPPILLGLELTIIFKVFSN